MKLTIRQKCLTFINSQKEYPLLAGFVIGLYMIVFYYSNNLELFSWIQLAYFICYYAVLPMLALFFIARVLSIEKYKKYRRQGIFIVAAAFIAFFILENTVINYSYKKVFLGLFFIIVWLSFKINNYKPGILLLVFMSVFPMARVGYSLYESALNSSDWNKQPDGIIDCKFVEKANVYFIQVDGYANANALKGKHYRFDNSRFENWLQESGFTRYESFRSNYASTLKSNASCFNMKHHYSKENSISETGRDYILGKNPVLEIFKKNGYKTFFITERPYLIMNRPEVYYDFSNFTADELPFLKDGWSIYKDITDTFKAQITRNKSSKNFFFVQKLSPSHVAVHAGNSLGIDGERTKYLTKLQQTNLWVREMVAFINKNDPNGIVILGADHGGFVGFNDTHQSIGNITDESLLQSIFGAQMAIKWNKPDAEKYGKHIKTSVNTFRILFAFMSQNEQYLKTLQPDVSYNRYDLNDPAKIYKAIE